MMNIKETLRKKLLKEAAGHDYGCVMLYLPIDKKWWDGITSEIKEEDVYSPKGERDYGIQPHDECHVTVLYGLHSDIPDSDIEDLINKMTSPEVTLKKITMFDNADKGFDVVKFDVEGDELFEMNKMFAEMPHTTDYPDYHPHCTISYVKGGTGKDYTKTLSDDEAVTVRASKVVYSKASGEKKEYSLK